MVAMLTAVRTHGAVVEGKLTLRAPANDLSEVRWQLEDGFFHRIGVGAEIF
jgi:hypothetical protein